MHTHKFNELISRRFDQIMDILDLDEEDKNEALGDAGHDEQYFEGFSDCLLQIISILRGDQLDFDPLFPQYDTIVSN